MSRQPKSDTNIQVFRGSRQQLDPFSEHAGDGCCGTGTVVEHDKLGCRVRFDNALAHSNPTGANDKWQFQIGFDLDKNRIIKHINTNKVGAEVSVLVVPTFSFVTGVAITVLAEEPGLTFELVTRNGLALPEKVSKKIEMAKTDGCCPARTVGAADFGSFGALGDNDHVILLGRDGDGEFAEDADELILKVKTMPASGVIAGTFDLIVAVSYDVITRAVK